MASIQYFNNYCKVKIQKFFTFSVWDEEKKLIKSFEVFSKKKKKLIAEADTHPFGSLDHIGVFIDQIVGSDSFF